MIPTIPPTADELLAEIDRVQEDLWEDESLLSTVLAWVIVILVVLLSWAVAVAIAFAVVQALLWVAS